LLPFTENEIRLVLAHGPWPMEWKPDPGNRASGRIPAVDFGEKLFFDTRLSADGRFSCATCHVPELNWTDNRRRGIAAGEAERNTPSLVNLRHASWYGWDGAADSLWSQAIRPILERRELGASPAHVAKLVRSDRDLACRYEKAFGTRPAAAGDETVLVGAAKAIAAFLEMLASGYTDFDAFRDALVRGDIVAAARYPEAAQRGLKVFIGKGACASCHAGPNFTSGGFERNGVAADGDVGREGGVARLKASRFNLLGAYNEDASRKNAAATRAVAADPRDRGRFKVPSLRNVALTAPYMHDGRFAALPDVVRHYSETGAPSRGPLGLTAGEAGDLAAFLGTLALPAGAWHRAEGQRCG
jgi:cytochrome c peroxidase